MSLFQSLFADITFFEVAASLIVIGFVERIVIRLPETVVGPEGWLLTTNK